MSYSPGVGLILGLNIDSSALKSGLGQAETELQAYERALDEATERQAADFAKAAEETDKGLLSNRETARLLSAELGLHMPRAVTSAVAKMLPEIESFGGALLAVFAVEQAWKWGKAAVDAIREAEGQTKELESIMHTIVEEQEKLLRHPKTLKEATADLDETTRRIGGINEEIAKLHKDLVDTPKEAAQAVAGAAGAWGTPMMAEAAATSATAVNASKRLNELQSQLDLLTARQKEQLDAKTELQKKADEEETRSHEKAAEAAKRAAAETARRAKEEEEFIVRLTEEGDRSVKRMQEWHEQWLKSLGMPEEVKFSVEEINRAIKQNGLAAALALPQITALGGGFRQLTEAERAALPLGAAITDGLLRQAQHIHEVAAELEEHELPARRQIELEYQKQVDAANREIAALRNEYQQHKITRAQMEADEQAYTQLMVDLAEKRKKAEKAESDAKRESQEAEGGEIVDEIATLVGNTKTAAEIRGAYDAALAIEWWAKFIASYGTDAHAGLTAVKYSLAAAEMFEVAGKSQTSGAGIGSSGGAGGGYREEGYGERGGYGPRGGGGGDYERAASGSGLAPGAQGSNGGRLNVYVVGDEAAFIAERVNAADAAGHFMQVTSSRRSAPAQG